MDVDRAMQLLDALQAARNAEYEAARTFCRTISTRDRRRLVAALRHTTAIENELHKFYVSAQEA